MADPTRPRGRPRAQEPRTSVSAWLPASQYDQLVKAANRREQSVSAYVRSVLQARRPPHHVILTIASTAAK